MCVPESAAAAEDGVFLSGERSMPPPNALPTSKAAPLRLLSVADESASFAASGDLRLFRELEAELLI
jgi:hypothetical protein